MDNKYYQDEYIHTHTVYSTHYSPCAMYMGYWSSVRSRWLDIGQVLFWGVFIPAWVANLITEQDSIHLALSQSWPYTKEGFCISSLKNCFKNCFHMPTFNSVFNKCPHSGITVTQMVCTVKQNEHSVLFGKLDYLSNQNDFMIKLLGIYIHDSF